MKVVLVSLQKVLKPGIFAWEFCGRLDLRSGVCPGNDSFEPNWLIRCCLGLFRHFKTIMANREHIASAVNIGDSESDVRLYLLIPGRMEVASFYV